MESKLYVDVIHIHGKWLFFFTWSLFAKLDKHKGHVLLLVTQRTNNKTPWSSFSMVLLWQKEDMKVKFCDGVTVNVNSVLAHSQFMWFCLGKTLCNTEQFGQYPLQVNGFNNLDECLEGAMVEKEIESLHSEHGITSGREVNGFINWLTVEFLPYFVFSASACAIWCCAKTLLYFLLVAEMVEKVTTSLDIWTVQIWIQHPARSSREDTQETGVPTNHLYGQVSFPR